MTEAVRVWIGRNHKGEDEEYNDRGFTLAEWLRSGRSRETWAGATFEDGLVEFDRARPDGIYRTEERSQPYMAKKKAITARAKKPTRPKAQLLGGMEDSAIPELEKYARRYAEIRDERMELTTEESKLKAKTMASMKAHKKTVYKRAGVEIRIVEASEDLKVKVKDKPEEVEFSSLKAVQDAG